MNAPKGPKRILTIASGKGGVGKTTLAINYALALSEYAPTVLIDLDFETASLRSFIDMDFPRDLYHFFQKDEPLDACMTPLPESLDRDGLFNNFSIIASPRHYVDELSRISKRERRRLIHAIHTLPVDYVVIDLKAGVSADVVDYLPYSNSGILIFTPRLPAATAAAAYLVKAQIFRKIHLALEPSSVLVEDLDRETFEWMMDLLLRADDVYDSEIQNLDTMLDALRERLKHHPVVTALERMIGTFRVHYVLNHFSGLTETFEKAVRPFMEHLAQLVSTRLVVRNLGWIQFHHAIHDANCLRHPPFLRETYRKKRKRKPQKHLLALEDIRRSFLQSDATVLEQPANETVEPEPAPPVVTPRPMERYLDDQVSQLVAMSRFLGRRNFMAQFRYIAAHSIHRMKTERPYHFGDVEILEPQALQQRMLDYYRREHGVTTHESNPE